MPTVLRVGGLRFVMYANDHSPAPIHILGPGWVVVVNLQSSEVHEVIGRARSVMPSGRSIWRRSTVQPCWMPEGSSMVELTDQQVEAARQRGEARLRGPRALGARYDAGRGRVVITLSTGIEFGLAPRDVEGLAGASAEDLRVVEVDAVGLGIHLS